MFRVEDYRKYNAYFSLLQKLIAMENEYFQNQKKLFFEYLIKHTVTCSMASKALNIPQKNLTRYKRQLENAGKLKACFKSICRVTNHRAEYLTTNPEIINTLRS